MFLVLGTMCERRNVAAFASCVLASATVISLAMLTGWPELSTYRGLSGIDTGLFALLAVNQAADARADGNRLVMWGVALAVLGLIAKTSFELLSEATIFVDHSAAAFVPVPWAHVAGAVVGCAVGLAAQALPWRIIEKNSPKRGLAHHGERLPNRRFPLRLVEELAVADRGSDRSPDSHFS